MRAIFSPRLRRGLRPPPGSQASQKTGQNQGVQFPLARAYAELEAAGMICRRAAARLDAGEECGADANMAKLVAPRYVLKSDRLLVWAKEGNSNGGK